MSPALHRPSKVLAVSRRGGRGRLAAGLLLALAAFPACEQPPEETMVKPSPPRPDEAPAPATPVELDAGAVARFVDLALACVHREYPNKVTHVLQSDADAQPPRALTPIFYGCFDWHSAVHGHWLLVRAARTFPDAPFVPRVREALGRSFTAQGAAAEVAYLEGPDRGTFERPYGLAWLLQLAAELRQWDDPDAQRWRSALDPVEAIAAQRFREWLPKLSHPIRTGEHSQTAFAMGLVLDWARTVPDPAMVDLVVRRARDYHLRDAGCNLTFEPGGQDFLSPCLAVADLMRRVLLPADFAPWLDAFLPAARPDGPGDWVRPAVVTDPTDGKLAHLDGLNLSRAWMLDGIAAGLPDTDPRRARIHAAAAELRAAGVASVGSVHYEGSHWLGTFAMYLVSERGLR